MARILLAEDDDTIRSQYYISLTFEGHDVVVAEDGQEALDIFNKDNFDLVITDFSMPFINGAQLTEKIKEQKPKCPVIMVTTTPPEVHKADVLLPKLLPHSLINQVKLLLG